MNSFDLSRKYCEKTCGFCGGMYQGREYLAFVHVFLIAFFSFYLCKQIFAGYLFSYLSFISLLQRVALIVRLCAQIFQTAFVPLISTGPGKIVDGLVVSVQVNILHLFSFFVSFFCLFFCFFVFFLSFFFSSLVQFKFILAPSLG